MAWLAERSSKRLGEKAVLAYTPVWILCMIAIVWTRWYETFGPHEYIGVGVAMVIPILLLPLLFKEESVPFCSRYIVKANVYIAILSYIGNHFYTHYFYNVLGMRYTGPLAEGIHINSVPLSMFLMTHVYFMSYHVSVSLILRVVRGATTGGNARFIVSSIVIVILALLTAAGETWTISSFPYYTYPDLYSMMTTGSVFYSLFFVVTFPMFFRLDEDSCWSLSRVVLEALAAMMMVLVCADWWRLLVNNTSSIIGQSD